MKTRILKLLQQNPAGIDECDIVKALGEPQEQVVPALMSWGWSQPIYRDSMNRWHLVDVSAAPKQAEPKNYADFAEAL